MFDYKNLNFITPKERVVWFEDGNFEGGAFVATKEKLTALFHPEDSYYNAEMSIVWEEVVRYIPSDLMIKELVSMGYRIYNG